MKIFSDINKIFFIGIGGIGMSGLARYFVLMGKEVYGYDKTETTLTKELTVEGIQVHYTDNVNLIPEGIDLVVYTPAVPKSQAQFSYFRDHNFPILKRSEVLGKLSRERRVLAVAGTHGKTTTSTILTHILLTSGIKCTAFLGGISENLHSNFVYGEDNWMVIEADEYDRSFLHLHPMHAVITSADADHLDIYGDVTELRRTFVEFGNQVSKEGKLLLREGLAIIPSDFNKPDQVISYGITEGKIYAENIQVIDGYFHFDYVSDEGRINQLKFTLPGRHNIENAVAAISIAKLAGVDDKSIKDALLSFKGIKRRFEFLHRGKKIYIDDYAHHPGEIRSAIQATRELFPGKKILGIFQPHLYSRTRDFVRGFAEELSKLDEVWLMDIYPAREEPIKGISSQIILDLITNSKKAIVNRDEILQRLKVADFDIVMTLGAGDID
ncbi:MAG TPA: UDP-N-acetylmuramate--L-alanine ligase, partial [Saprospiraceae bacterium]|nr:UDP-N-acetylmuramate--L-alanine ligase [Saprospiraceae bacterium]